MKKIHLNTVSFFITLLFLSFDYNVSGQSLKDYSVMISGTSTLHDWESDVKQISSQAQIATTGNHITSIEKLEIEMQVNSIESGKDKMNNNTYQALKASDHPNIKFKLSRVKNITDNEIIANGDLEIAGVIKNIDLKATASITGNALTLNGSYTLKMTDFNVEPPVLMLGTLKTGDEVTIAYKIVYQL